MSLFARTTLSLLMIVREPMITYLPVADVSLMR